MLTLREKLKAYGCDIDSAMERFLNNDDFYTRCFNKFLQHQSFTDLHEAMINGDAPVAFEYAHDLKGISGNMGITPMFQLLSTLCTSLKQGIIPTNGQEMCQQILAIKKDLENF